MLYFGQQGETSLHCQMLQKRRILGFPGEFRILPSINKESATNKERQIHAG